MGIIQKTRPLIGQANPEEELRLLEEKANNTYGQLFEQLETKKRLEQENIDMDAEKKTLLKQLESEQGNMSEYTERQAKASAQKADLEVQLVDSGNRLVDMEQKRLQATADKKILEGEKTNRDHSIRTLNDEIANQDEVINKLNKEK